MEKFRIKAYSKGLYGLLILTNMFVSVVLTVVTLKITDMIVSSFFYKYIFTVFIILGVVFSIFYFFTKYCSHLIEIRFNEESIEIIDLKPYFYRVYPLEKQLILLDAIASYKFYSNRDFSTMKIKLSSHEVIKIHTYHDDQTEDTLNYYRYAKRYFKNAEKKQSNSRRKVSS